MEHAADTTLARSHRQQSMSWQSERSVFNKFPHRPGLNVNHCNDGDQPNKAIYK
ncbi:hypothetical protein HDE79_001333 [Rhodanobacter sp. MP1X3]|nr:hypothetical protein [Rhodanobacter sp. MP1X3]